MGGGYRPSFGQGFHLRSQRGTKPNFFSPRLGSHLNYRVRAQKGNPGFSGWLKSHWVATFMIPIENGNSSIFCANQFRFCDNFSASLKICIKNVRGLARRRSMCMCRFVESPLELPETTSRWRPGTGWEKTALKPCRTPKKG